MKTTYVVGYNSLEKLKLNIIPKKKVIDYFLDRTKMIRWDQSKNRFTEFIGLIDISFIREMDLTPDEAKSQVNLKNVQYLVNRDLLGEYYFGEENKYGLVWHVVGEDVKEHFKLIDEYHIVFDERIVDRTPPFSFKTVFYGNVFDYLEQKNVERKM